MFGNTLLRIAQKGRTQNALFNYAINYSAQVDLETTNPFIYSFFGLFGGYDGVFALLPYYNKIGEYSESELREIWEYPLNFSAEERHHLMAHLWELRFTSFP